MRTRIEIDDKLMAEALKISGARTKRGAVELALRTMVQIARQEAIRRLRGKIPGKATSRSRGETPDSSV